MLSSDVAQRFDFYRCTPLLMKLLAAIAGSIAVIICYALTLSEAGWPASIPVLFAILFAATLSSIAGFAFSAICGVMLLSMISDPVHVVEIMMVCSIAIQSFSVGVLWRHIEWRLLTAFLIGGVFGLPVGVELLLNLRHHGFREVIGLLLIAYATYAIFKRPIVIKSGGKLADGVAGFLGGITGGLAGFPGATVTIWCGLRGWDKQRQRGIYQPFILIMQIAALVLIQVLSTSRAHGHGLDLASIEFVPAALLGTWFGLGIFRQMSDRSFVLTVNVLLLASGLGLLI